MVLVFAISFTGLYLYLYLIRNVERNVAELLSGSMGLELKEEVEKIATMFILLAALVLAPAGALLFCYTLMSSTSNNFSPISILLIGKVILTQYSSMHFSFRSDLIEFSLQDWRHMLLALSALSRSYRLTCFQFCSTSKLDGSGCCCRIFW